jgi:outer membrane protein OmpA-like peptidoglycan-associated protein
MINRLKIINMKKTILLSVLILFSIQLMSQEKGSYISIWGGMGPSGFMYKINGIDYATPKRDIQLGGQAGIGYSYFFTKNIGVSTGIGYSRYRTRILLEGDFQKDKYFIVGNYTDNESQDYQLRVRTQNWTESQSGNFIEIPVMASFQKKFGERENFGLFLSVGAKLQVPFSAKYSIVDDENFQKRLMVSGYYPVDNVEFGGFGGKELPQHGFDNIHNPSEILNSAQGKLNFRLNMSAVAEAGILISLSRRVDIALGAFIDYGFVDINNKEYSKAMFSGPNTDYITDAENKVGNGITYYTILNSTYGNDNSRYVDKVKSFSYGGKIGLRFKLGKLSQKQEPQVTFVPCEKDTIYIYQYERQSADSILNEVMDAIKEMQRKEAVDDSDKEKSSIESEFPHFIPQDDIDSLFAPIYFDLDKAILKTESIKDLDKKVEILNKYPEMKLVIYGNTCDLGNDTYNIKLGKKRAEVARNYLINKGISAERLESGTLSKYQPEKPNTDEPNRMHNRRDDFKPVYQKQ